MPPSAFNWERSGEDSSRSGGERSLYLCTPSLRDSLPTAAVRSFLVSVSGKKDVTFPPSITCLEFSPKGKWPKNAFLGNFPVPVDPTPPRSKHFGNFSSLFAEKVGFLRQKNTFWGV